VLVRPGKEVVMLERLKLVCLRRIASCLWCRWLALVSVLCMGTPGWDRECSRTCFHGNAVSSISVVSTCTKGLVPLIN
jgi:hypothetical protein